MKTSIIVPTRERTPLLLTRMRTLEERTPELAKGTAELFFSIDEDDTLTRELICREFPGAYCVFNRKLEYPAVKWNNAAKLVTGDWLVTISDDSLVDPNWLTSAFKTINSGFIGLPDGITGNRNSWFTPLYMATREWLRKYHGGVLVIPHYQSWYADMETGERAHRSGTYVYARNSVVTQLHADLGSAPNDDMYKLGRQRRRRDYELFEERKKLGFPDNFERVL